MDTLEGLARLIQRQRITRGERCHLLITRQVDNNLEGYKVLAELLREGYFSTIVTTNADTMLERALDESGLFPSGYRVFTCGREPDDEVVIALDAQESGICIIKLSIYKNGPCASDVWKSLLDYLKENIVVVGSINGAHDDVIQALIAEREKSSLYYIVPAEFSGDKLLSHMRKHQQSANFLICGSDGLFVNFFHGLAEHLLQKGLFLPEHDIIIDEETGSGEATDTTDKNDHVAPPDSEDQPMPEGKMQKTQQLPVFIEPDVETRPPPVEEQFEIGEQARTRSGPLRASMPALELLDEDQLIKSGPLELDSPLYDARSATRRLPWPARVDMLIVTVTNIELKAILARYPGRARRTVHGKTYYDLGYVSRTRTVVVQANNMGPIEAQATADEGIRVLSPQAVIMVGIAFGLRPKEQRIGDVLVSMLIHDYDLERVGTGEDDQLFSHPRGTRVKASDWLIDRFLAGSHEWSVPPEIHFGSILSGSKLVDNKEYQDALRRSAPDAIGGEMEGVGFSTSALRHKVDWLLVKGISDWADGTKGENKVANQRLAAENAARFVLFVIGQEDFMHRP